MGITVQNIPFLCLILIGIGFVFIILGIFMIAARGESNSQYTEISAGKLSADYNKEVGELFSFFLEEEEKKNQGLREMVLEAVSKRDITKKVQEPQRKHAANNRPESAVLKSLEQVESEAKTAVSNNHQPTNPEVEVNEIIKLYKDGLTSEEIAKKLKKGVGEVNLMISLYTMR